jgi:hypothetical protein
MTEEITTLAPRQEVATLTLKNVKDRVNLVHNILETVMKKGTHYGEVPGCGKKMVLLKPGADVLAMTFRLVPRFVVERTDLENGHREYSVTCTMTGPSGEVLGQGVGSASTMEKKYRYRKDDSGKKIENEDIADVYNTVLKIAKKRAHIDATLTVTGAADLFTQDLIDEDDVPAKKPVSMPKAMIEPAAGGTVVVGPVQDISVKTGEKNGKPWTKYGVKIGGEWFGTFDEAHHEVAKAAKESGAEVSIEYKVDGKYRTVVAISEAGNGPSVNEDPSGPVDAEGRPL